MSFMFETIFFILVRDNWKSGKKKISKKENNFVDISSNILIMTKQNHEND